jgi:2-dehydropantoate 2-reductase
MRIVVLGAGGIGGTIGARLHLAGHEVVLVARGAHGEVLRHRGLTFVTPDERVELRIPTFARPADVSWRADDVLVLATKSQDTESAVREVAAAAGRGLPVVSAQNGVANERALTRWFEHVHGLCVMLPAQHLEPGVVVAHSSPTAGILDLGRFPEGSDDVDDAVAEALRASRFESVPRGDIMRWKYRKLLNNLGNAVQALCGSGNTLDGDDALAALDLLVAEADAVFAAAGIDPVSEAEDDERRADHLQVRPIDGAERSGGSTWQSLARRSGVETDYLNGEIAHLGRLYAVATPANARIQTLMAEAAARRAVPGEMTASALLAVLRG